MDADAVNADGAGSDVGEARHDNAEAEHGTGEAKHDNGEVKPGTAKAKHDAGEAESDAREADPFEADPVEVDPVEADPAETDAAEARVAEAQAPAREGADDAELWRRLRDHGDAEAREALVRLHLPFSRAVAASQYARRSHDEVGFEEYRQLASLGLMEALARYDPAMGVRFTTYAWRRIQGAILNGLECLTEKQRQAAVRTDLRRERLRRERLESLADGHTPGSLGPPKASSAPSGGGQGAAPSSGRSPSPATRNRVSAQDLLFQRLADIGIGLALGRLLEGTGMMDDACTQRPASTCPYDRLELQRLRERMRRLVDGLPPQQRTVVQAHYLEGTPFAELAGLLGVTRGRVSQIHRQALETLRVRLGEEVPWERRA